MSDIVERLRGLGEDLVGEAADEIELLRDTLVNIDELVEDCADADDGQPNLAMRVMIMVRAALGKA